MCPLRLGLFRSYRGNQVQKEVGGVPEGRALPTNLLEILDCVPGFTKEDGLPI